MFGKNKYKIIIFTVLVVLMLLYLLVFNNSLVPSAVNDMPISAMCDIMADNLLKVGLVYGFMVFTFGIMFVFALICSIIYAIKKS